MLRSFTLQPLSLVIGVVFSAVVLLSMSQAPPLNARTINVQYLPDPRDMVQVHGGTPFTVPAGRIFVLTAVGSTGYGPYQPLVRVDGHAEVLATGNPSCGLPASMTPMPAGFTAPAGSVVEVADQQNGASQEYRAWGYLAPQ